MSRTVPRQGAPDLDLGSGVRLFWTCWDPDLVLNPQYAHLADQLPVERWGASLEHQDAKGEPCVGVVVFDEPVQRAVSQREGWQVLSWEPLTISPSVLCDCGWHGFIREGRWVPA